LEQLRVLWMGRTIQVGVVKHAAVGVDTRADYERFVKAYREARASAAA
jgi:CMP-2-keto-3-deoxyoctulosonic acid synthetase